MKNIAISNHELMRWVYYLGIYAFIRVISRDQIPKINKYGCYIVNLDDISSPGSHWIAIHIKPNIIQYFDSFGIYPSRELVKLAKKNNMRYIYSSSHYQNINSTTCGYFCIYYVHQSCKLKKEFHQIVKPFKTDTISNENFIQKYFENI